VPDQFGKRIAKVGILIPLREQLRESLDRDKRVFDLVRHPGRECAEAGQTIATANEQLQPLEWR